MIIKMNQLSPQDIKSIQLEVLQEFHDFCITHGLKYSLCAGTLLGAIRHGGYIPWDDDIDVMMPRKDYQLLLELFNSEKCTLYHYSIQKGYMLSYAKICDNCTFVEEGDVYECGYGIDIDVFPLDFFPDSVEESQKWSWHLGLLKDIRTIKNIKLSKNRPLYRNVLLVIYRFLAFPIPMKWLVRRVDVLAQKYSYKTDGFCGNMTNGYRMKERNPMAQSYIDVEFEGRIFKAINNYDVYLTALFGNYMQLPPENKRVSTHVYKAFVK